MRFCLHPRTIAFAVSLTFLTPNAALAQGAPPVPFVLPLDCEIGRTCFVQNYVDVDPSPSAKDFTCGSRSYEKHNGTDFRVLSMADQRRGVAVVAAAPGKVLRVRDGVEDVSVRERSIGAVAGQECGNGIVVDHGRGWTTQYCHMAKGSVTVKAGDAVAAGQRVGRIGLSGQTEYPHLHFTVRHDDRIVDPFALDAPPGTCGLAQATAWAKQVEAALAYVPRAVLNAGFSSAPVTNAEIENGNAGARPPGADAPAFIGFVRAIGLRQGDVQRMTITAPDGSELVRTALEPLPRDQAQSMIFAGRKRPASGFPLGEYRALYEVVREGQPVLSHTMTFRIGS
jgi:murein DD-endopeptidase MepM/ murein hydrolase activator NlpD